MSDPLVLEKLDLVCKAREHLAEGRRYIGKNYDAACDEIEIASELIEDAFGGIGAEADAAEDRLVGNLTDSLAWLLAAPEAARGYVDGVRQTLAVIAGRLEKLP